MVLILFWPNWMISEPVLGPYDQFRIDICWWCDAVDLIASSPGRTTTSKQILGELLSSAQPETKDKTDKQTEPNEPPKFDNLSQSPFSATYGFGMFANNC